MKKLLLFTFAAFVLVFLVRSEASGQSPFELGVRAGYNSSNATFDPDPYTMPGTSKSSGSGFWVEGAAELPVSDVIAITTEPRYIQYALKAQATSAGQMATVNTKLGYLEIPLFLKARFGSDYLKFFAFAGPSVGFRLSATEDVDFAGQTTQSTDLKDQFRSASFGAAVGGGIEYQIAPGVAFVVDARYSRDLSNVSNAPSGTTLNPSVKYYGVQVGGGLMFALR
jgi:opacity protein-like surface antigen